MIETAQRLGYQANGDANGAVRDGFGVPDFTISKGRRHSTARAYLVPVRVRANLTVRTGASVDRVLIEKGRAVGVEYGRQGRTEQVSAGEVILSGGACGSPQMLMLSGVGPAAHLRDVGVET